jgi:hypothetical protein
MGVAINAHLFLDLRPEILDQMKTVSHLAGLRCALPGCLGIQATAISANDLDGRTFSQPCFCALDAAVVQNIDDRMTLEIDHDRAVPGGLPPAPIINAHDPNIVFFMDAGLSRFDCRKIVSSLTGMPSRCIKFSPGRPPILWLTKPTISPIRSVRRT